MERPGSSPEQRLADWLNLARHRHFVGRSGELELFRSTLAKRSFALLWLHGPGGIGKTALLEQYYRLAGEAGLQAVRLDARSLEPTPEALLAAARPLPAEGTPDLILLDTYEQLAPLDGWMREHFLPDLPGSTLVVIAGRNPPGAPWRSDRGWQELMRSVALRNLSPDESADYLDRRGVPHGLRASIVGFTHGHPLALSLAADVAHQSGGDLRPESSPEVIGSLLERFVERVDRPGCRQALEVCAHARVTTESLLRGVLPGEDAFELFQWLRRLSFIEQGDEGIFPHDVAREVLDADYRWRDPDQYAQMHRRLRQYAFKRLEEAPESEHDRTSHDLLYLHRYSPAIRQFFLWDAFGQVQGSQAQPNDRKAILAMVNRHEGAESAAIAGFWFDRQRERFIVMREAGSELVGFMANLDLSAATAEALAIDPGARAITEYVRRQGPARPDEEIAVLRFAMARDTYNQISPQMNLVASKTTLHWLKSRRLAWSFLVTDAPARWQPVYSYIDHPRTPEADFVVGGRQFTVSGHDWRAVPVAAWMDLMSGRVHATGPHGENSHRRPADQLVVLSEPAFHEAVKRALREFTRPAALAENPLLRSRLVAEHPGGDPTPGLLQAILREAAESLRARPREDRLYRAVLRTYLQPAPTQEAAAELLAVPFSTYRRHLTTGVRQLTEWLWHREVNGW